VFTQLSPIRVIAEMEFLDDERTKVATRPHDMDRTGRLGNFRDNRQLTHPGTQK
jgi:hypothetical protein